MSNSPSNESRLRSKAGAWKGLCQRSVVAAMLIPLVILVTWAGGIWFEALMIVMGVLVVREWVAMVHGGDRVQQSIYLVGVVAAGVAANHGSLWIATLVVFVAWVTSIGLCTAKKQSLGRWAVVGVPYVCVPIAALIMLRSQDHIGMIAILWIFSVVWLADTLAYFAGKTIGGPKLAPGISPNKTWAGLAGAIAGGIAGSLLVAGGAGFSGLVVLAFIGGLFAVLEQAGDLFESAAKRHFGLKDSGAIIPGHGGVLDRVDGLMAVAAAAWLLGILRGGVEMPASGLLVW